MNQKPLANILIKVLGLSLCAQSVTHILSAVINLFSFIATTRGSYSGGLYMWLNPFLGAVPAIIGFLFIALSKPIADLLLRDE